MNDNVSFDSSCSVGVDRGVDVCLGICQINFDIVGEWPLLTLLAAGLISSWTDVGRVINNYGLASLLQQQLPLSVA